MFIMSVFSSEAGDVWLGGSDKWSEGNWVWEDGSSISGFTNWYTLGLLFPAQPDGDGDCLQMAQTFGTWFDKDCNSWFANRAVCEIEL